MKDKLIKVRRKRYNWVKILHSIDCKDFNDYFFKKLSILHSGKFVSANRIAYSTLKHFYSTTTIDELVKVLGL